MSAQAVASEQVGRRAAGEDDRDARLRILGRVSSGGKSIQGATVRLEGDASALGLHRQAALQTTARLAWTRSLTGFDGTLRQCWRAEVEKQVAGLTWSSFAREFREYNPGFDGKAGRLEPERRYRLPENSGTASDIVWERPGPNLTGNVRQIWERAVARKVVGLTYDGFKAEFRERQRQELEKTETEPLLCLPRNAGRQTYYLAALTGVRGGFRFEQIPPGTYTLTVDAEGMEPIAVELVCTEAMELLIVLRPPSDDMMSRRMRVGGDFATAGRDARGRSAARGSGGHPWMGVHNDELVAGDRAFRFVGVNLRGLVHYGDGQTLVHAQREHQWEQLQAAYDMGARVARIFVASAHAGVEVTVERLRELVSVVRTHFPGFYLLPLFANLYNSVPFRIPGDDDFFARIDPHFPGDLLTADFFGRGYRRNYLPFVRRVVSALRDEPVIMAWEIGNELKLNPAAGHAIAGDPHLESFIRFMHTAAAEIRGLDPNHLITTGMISTHHAWLHNDSLQYRLYGTSHFDFLTVHCYNEEYENDDSRLAAHLKKPFIVEEAGFGQGYGNDRREMVRRDMDFWFGRGARGYMQWGFMAPRADMGDGDHDSGMDRVFHGDWDALFALYRARAEELARTLPAWRVEPGQPGTGVSLDADLPGNETAAAFENPLEVGTATGSGFAMGQRVFAQTWLNVRRGAGHLSGGGEILGQVAPGIALEIRGAAVAVDGLVWWPVETELADGRRVAGWAAEALPGQILLAAEPARLDEDAATREIQSGRAGPEADGAARRAVARAAQAWVGQARFALVHLNLRREPGLVNKAPGDVLGVAPAEARMEILRAPVQADDLTWHLVRTPLMDNSVAVGWVAEYAPDGTRLLASVRPEPDRPRPGGSLGPGIGAGHRVRVLVELANVRRSPDLGNDRADHVVGTVTQGTQLQVTGEMQLGDGVEWVPVTGDDQEGRRVDGWVALWAPNGTRLLVRADLGAGIHLRRPFEPHIPMSQGWGLRPEIYHTIRYDGVPLKGHNGLDFATPVGVPILAADEGDVLRIGYEAGGFGHHLLLRHAWGETLYAHLDRAPTVEGAVQAGGEIGISGESGFCQGAHLHFGVRVFPYRRTDGWGGFVNPVPLMRREDLVLPRRAAPVTGWAGSG